MPGFLTETISGQQWIYILGGVAGVWFVFFLRAAIRWSRRPLPAPPPDQQAPPSADASRDAPSADQVFRDAALNFLGVQVSTHDTLDTKAAGALSVGSTLLPLTVGLLTLLGESSIHISSEVVILLVAATFFYLGLLAFWWRASMVRGVEYRPNIATLEHHSNAYSGEVLRRWVAEEYAASIRDNAPELSRKARYVGVAVTALVVEVILLSAAALVAFWSLL
ncbi:MAG: hypothetical protein M3Q03_00260 [Chloroflexota bacterium]|nr:hypothetical protein [Chloroflexota bacterium]